MITIEQIQALVDRIVAHYQLPSIWYVIILLVLTAIASFLGAYLAEKGKNLATQEDINRLTNAIEDTKIQYARLLEDYKSHQRIREQAARVAELLAMANSPALKNEPERFHRLAWELSLWLPAELVRDITRCLCGDQAGKSIKEILIEARKVLLSDPNDTLLAEHIVHVGGDAAIPAKATA